MVRDVIDRSLVDLMSAYRDILVVQAGRPVSVVNVDLNGRLDALATALPAEEVLAAMDAIGVARERIAAAVPPLLALEAMMISLQVGRTAQPAHDVG